MGEGLFREEALKHHTGARASGDLLRVQPSWTRWTFAFLLLVFAGAAACATLGSVTVYAHGLAAIRAGKAGAASVTVYLPEQARSRLTEGLVIRIGTHRARLVSVEAEPMPLVQALARLGITAWPTTPPPSRLVVAEASIAADRVNGVAVAEEVVAAEAPIGEQSLLTLLLPALRSRRDD
jgi:hypothetical protein